MPVQHLVYITIHNLLNATSINMITKSYVINHVIFFRRLGVQLIIHQINLKILNMILLVIKYNLGKKKNQIFNSFKIILFFRYLCRELWKITLSEFDHNHPAPLNSFLFNFSQQWYLSLTRRKAKLVVFWALPPLTVTFIVVEACIDSVCFIIID